MFTVAMGSLEDERSLILTLEEMVDNPEYSDVVFSCQDGKRVHASRMMLVARSSVLKSMLQNGMIESRLSEISIPTISSPVLVVIFKYLYTGSIGTITHTREEGATAEEAALSFWSRSCEIIVASRFFLLPRVESVICNSMLGEVQKIEVLGGDLTKAATRLSIICDHSLAFELAGRNDMEGVCKTLIATLSIFTGSAHLHSLSEEAFVFLLQETLSIAETKSSCDLEPTLETLTASFLEFLRFRSIFLWLACQKFPPDQAEEVVKSKIGIPDPRYAWEIYHDSNKSVGAMVGPAEVSQYWESTFAERVPSSTLKCLFSFIRPSHIPHELLELVSEPMSILSGLPRDDATELLASVSVASSFAALRQKIAYKFPKLNPKPMWEYSLSGSMLPMTSSSFIKVDRNDEFAKSHLAIPAGYGLYKWEISFEKIKSTGPGSAKVGVINVVNHVAWRNFADSHVNSWKIVDSFAYGSNFSCSYLTVQQGSSELECRYRSCSSGQSVISKSWNLADSKVFTWKPIEVCLDMFSHCCSFSYEQQDSGEICSSLPSRGIYYPFISGNFSGKVAIRLISGFNVNRR